MEPESPAPPASVAVWQRAPLAFAIVLLLVGVALGFGVGYSVGDSGGSSTAKVANGNAGTGLGQNQKKKLTPAQAQQAKAKRNRLVTCMASHGVKWPQTPGGPNVNKPPPGVDHAKYNTALIACYKSIPRNTNSTAKP